MLQKNLTGFNLDILNSWLDKGLCIGAGDGEKSCCLEQAIALCAGITLTDKPDSCVSLVLSSYGRRLNDSKWSSDKARSEGVREFAYAQLGTAGILDEKKWVKRIAELTIRQIVPIALRNAAKKNPKHADNLESAAILCEKNGDRDSAIIGKKAADAAYAAYAAAYAADAATYAAYAAAYAVYTAKAADAYAAYAAVYVADTDDAAAADKILRLSASIAVQAINEQFE